MKHIEDYLEKDTVDTLLGYAKACSSRDHLMLRILWRTGIRVSELLSIRPQDLEPHNQVINITKAKGSKQRRVMLDPGTLDILSEYVSTHNIQEFQPVFTLSSVQVWNIVKKYGRMINADIHPHTFRYSFAIDLVRSGLDLRRVQQLLGHSNLNMTQVYQQFKDEDLREGTTRSNFNIALRSALPSMFSCLTPLSYTCSLPSTHDFQAISTRTPSLLVCGVADETL